MPALLATLLMIKAEALDAQGRSEEARITRLDSLGWARYGFGSDQEVRQPTGRDRRAVAAKTREPANMIVLACLVIGAVLGVVQARRRGGNRLDIWQYAGVFAIIGAIIGLFLTIGIDRMI